MDTLYLRTDKVKLEMNLQHLLPATVYRNAIVWKPPQPYIFREKNTGKKNQVEKKTTRTVPIHFGLRQTVYFMFYEDENKKIQ